MTKLSMPAFFDAHVHLRQGQLLRNVCNSTKWYASHVLVMPNTDPPICTGKDVRVYRDKIKSYIGSTEPIMTIKLLKSTTPEIILAAHEAGCKAVKIYPEGVTTNSADGIDAENIKSPSQNLWNCYEQMARLGMILCIHGEMPGVFCLDREEEFLVFFEKFLGTAPKNLKVVMEHITTVAAIKFIIRWSEKRGNIAATITPHHMVLTLDDVIGDKLKPDNFCKPLAKRPSDRESLLAAAVSGKECFFLGSDSAPHIKTNKRSAECCAGVYTAPILPRLMAHIFDSVGAIDNRLRNFGANFGAKFYQIKTVENAIHLNKKESMIESEYDGVVPLWAGQKLSWE